jgi:hypothetical protein
VQGLRIRALKRVWNHGDGRTKFMLLTACDMEANARVQAPWIKGLALSSVFDLEGGQGEGMAPGLDGAWGRAAAQAAAAGGGGGMQQQQQRW